jgi:pSer/pThr/pTyr-binding forkhead associated (FHA) protein
MFKLQHKETPSRSLWLVGEKISLGRDSSNDWVLKGLGVEDYHAEILIFQDHLLLKSAAGSCFVNNLPVDKEFKLTSGDELRIGNERMAVLDPKLEQRQDAVEPVAAPVVAAVEPEVLHWALIPEHPKLKQRDFSIVDRCVLGRSTDCEFTVPYKLLSREHAELTVVDNVLILQDLASANGCFVNGKQVQKVALNHGDKVAFAKLAFKVQAPGGKSASAQGLAAAMSSAARSTAADPDESNKTIIRPAVDIQAAIAREKQNKGRKGSVTLEIERQAKADAEAERNPPSFMAKRWPLLAVVAVLLLVGLWFSPINPL